MKSGTYHLLKHECDKILASLPDIVIPASVKATVRDLSVEFYAKDLRSYETLAGGEFLALAPELINIGATLGKVSALKVLPHPTTVLRNMAELVKSKRKEVVPDILVAIRARRRGDSTDMWGDRYTNISY